MFACPPLYYYGVFGNKTSFVLVPLKVIIIFKPGNIMIVSTKRDITVKVFSYGSNTLRCVLG